MGWLLDAVSELYIIEDDLTVSKLADVIKPAQIDLVNRLEADLEAGRPSRYIILKARQIGMSTIIEAVHFIMAMHKPNLKGLVVAHENDSSAHLLSMTKNYWDTFWAKAAWNTKHEAVTKLAWDNGTGIQIITAKNLGGGRSRTIQFLHASEVAFWPDPRTLMTGLAQALHRKPGTFGFLESTANGVGDYFYDTWNKAVAGQNIWVPLFYPWWDDPNYDAEHIGLAHLAEGTFYPEDDEERWLIKFFHTQRKVNDRTVPPLTPHEIKSRLIWRRNYIATECHGDLAKFHQEYPSTPEEAFISTGMNVFDQNRLKKIYEPKEPTCGRLVREGSKVRFIRESSGPLRIYRFPDEVVAGGFYMVGADSKQATVGDYCCAQVLNRKSWEQVAVLREKVDQNTFGDHLINLAIFYDKAMIAPETGLGGGSAVVGHIFAKGYDRVYQHRKTNKIPGQLDQTWGWVTNSATKPEAIGNLQSAIYDATTEPFWTRRIGLRIHDADTYREMKDYITLPNGNFGNAGGEGGEKNDDTVMALAIGLTCTKHEAVLMQNDPRYSAPRYQERDYESRLSRDQAEKFEGILATHEIAEGGVATKEGYDEGGGYDVPWLPEDQGPGMFDEGGWEE